MEHYDLVITEQVDRDIREAMRYITYTLRQPDTAERIRERVYREIFSLETMPERYALVRDRHLAGLGYRAVSVGQYLLFYTVDNSAKIVRVVRFFHGSRNWAELLPHTH